MPDFDPEGFVAAVERLGPVIKHVTKRLRQHWPNTRIVSRGDSHYGRVEAMEWVGKPMETDTPRPCNRPWTGLRRHWNGME
jgi:hypothetical protein